MAIVKVPVRPDPTFVHELPAGARFLVVNAGEAWFSMGDVEGDTTFVPRRFHAVKVGDPLPEETKAWRYLGTAGTRHLFLENPAG
jgi:hypothetical protein